MYEIGDKMSERNIYKLFKELDDCEKRCLKALLKKEENNKNGDKKIKELIEWLKKDQFSADSMGPIVDKFDKMFDDVHVKILIIDAINIQGYRNGNQHILLQINDDCNGITEIVDIVSLLENEIEDRGFFLDNEEVIDDMIKIAKEAYEDYYGDE